MENEYGRMLEGWHQEQHFILFSDDEAEEATQRYEFAEILPGFLIVGLRGWDDFIVRTGTGELFTVPTVPAVAEYLEPVAALPTHLEPDELRAGLIKWYVKPVVFGGSPEMPENMIWIDHQLHAELVVWWNRKYREIARIQRESQGGVQSAPKPTIH